jgi:hypothetical protein
MLAKLIDLVKNSKTSRDEWFFKCHYIINVFVHLLLGSIIMGTMSVYGPAICSEQDNYPKGPEIAQLCYNNKSFVVKRILSKKKYGMYTDITAR